MPYISPNTPRNIKIALVLAIAGCGSLDLSAVTSAGFFPTGWLAGLTIGLRWAPIDQRQRWYGTELICGQGHGLLYVPEIPTRCCSTQRWQYLDPSRSSLFSL